MYDSKPEYVLQFHILLVSHSSMLDWGISPEKLISDSRIPYAFFDYHCIIIIYLLPFHYLLST